MAGPVKELTAIAIEPRKPMVEAAAVHVDIDGVSKNYILKRGKAANMALTRTTCSLGKTLNAQ